MSTKLILLVSLATFWWLIKRDNRLRDGVSAAVWIPTLWVGIIASRPLSMWLGFGGGSDTQGGSPMDALFFMVMIFASLIVLSRRQVAWSRLISENWAIFLFYGFLLVSVLWANSPFVSFKRWFKELGNIFVLLVILTEANPQQALRAVFFRCGCVLIPLSYIFIRWFPDLGRVYNIHSGGMEATGVTCQKNSLGAMILVCSLIILWDWLTLLRLQKQQPKEKLRLDLYFRGGLLLLGAYLLHICDSKTSMSCLALGAGVIFATRLPLLQKRIRSLGALAVAGFVGYLALNQIFDVKAEILHDLGRNADITGRTEVWQALLNAGTDPILGTGYMDIWDDPRYTSKLPDGDTVSAHSGYLEIYLCSGAVGVFFLAIMILASGVRINRALGWDGDYGVVRFAIFLAALLANYTESNFAWMTPIGFLFLIASIGHAEAASIVWQVDSPLDAAPEFTEEDIQAGRSAAPAPH
jgi:exopolysaccharide production protein ExoQ